MTPHDMKVNILMELIWTSNKSSNGMSNEMQEALDDGWKKLTPKGKEFFKNWANENDLVLRIKDGRD